MDNENQSGLRRPEESSREWKLIEKLVLDLQGEQRRSRRWGIFFKSLTFIYLFFIVFSLRLGTETEFSTPTGKYAAVVEVNGVIAADQDASADALINAIRDAYKDKKAVGLILRINSPGGSPVQAGYVYDEINRLKATREDFPVYAVIADMGASGAYYMAAAADEIYADKASLVGSIGVISAGFGVVEALDKLGIERRVYAAGENKNFLDPFSPEDPSQLAYWQEVLETTHRQFIEQVQKGRGDRLKQNPNLFTGLIWSGEQALEMGLIDGLGSASYVAREVIGAEEIVDYTPAANPFEQLAREFGLSVGRGISATLLSGQFGIRL